MTAQATVEVSVLSYVPPVIQGLVRDLRVRWALEEAGWPYREHVLDRNAQASAHYHTWQPFGQVPAFRSDQVTLFETGAIVLHIAEQSPALMPQDAGARSQVIAWMFGALNTIEPPISMLNVLDMVYQGPKGEELEALRGWIVPWIESRLDTLVHVLQGKDHLLGRFTAADLLLTTVLRSLRDTDFVRARPTLDAYQHRCEARPAFKRALADHLANFAKHAPPAAS